MIAVLGVIVLAGMCLGVAVLSAVAGRHPDRAAVLVVLAAAAGAVGLLLVLAAGILTLGLAGAESTSDRGGGATYDPIRVVAGLAVAASLLLLAGWLVRSGEWDLSLD